MVATTSRSMRLSSRPSTSAPLSSTGEVDHARLGVQLLEEPIGAAVAGQMRDLRGRVAEVTKGNGPCGARSRAGRDDLPVAKLAVLQPRLLLASGDPLYAERALLAHPALAHTDVWVQAQAG